MTNKPIAYKVIFIHKFENKIIRSSYSMPVDNPYCRFYENKIIRSSYSMPIDNPYCRFYNVGNIVTAVKNSVGLMCFETKYFAKLFISDSPNHIKINTSIIKVEPIGKPTYPELLSSLINVESLDAFYKNKHCSNYIHSPTGTVCYDSIKVLT